MSDAALFSTRLAFEASQTPEAARTQILRTKQIFAELGDRLRNNPPAFVAICSRGSSHHISTYGKYLIETQMLKPVASLELSVASVYNCVMDLKNSLFIVVSQSGKSPDILTMTEKAKKAGAYTVGFINDENSPLFSLCDLSIPLSAGPEYSVAATKSCLLSALAYLQLTAYWKQDPTLLASIDHLPDQLEAACHLDWSQALIQLQKSTGLYVIGRGAGLGIAQEVALKLKETSLLHAEAFSSAEVIHGPLALAREGFPVLLLGQNDETLPSILDAGQRFLKAGATLFSSVPLARSVELPVQDNLLPFIAPLCQLQSFYLAVSELAAKRGLDPDRPPLLNKVTETV